MVVSSGAGRLERSSFWDVILEHILVPRFLVDGPLLRIQNEIILGVEARVVSSGGRSLQMWSFLVSILDPVWPHFGDVF